MRLIIAGGGTGGHVFPAITIADEVLRRDQNDELLFVGTERGMENDLVKKRGYKIKHISSKGAVGRGVLKGVLAYMSAFKGLLQSFTIIREFKPDMVLGVGGYVSGPMVLAAALMRVPTAICEQNTVPGVTNRVLSKFVSRIFTSFPSSVDYFPGDKVTVSGNPVRREILEGTAVNKDNDVITILIFGGSQGAHKLNTIIPEALSKLDIKVNVIHQTGKNDVEQVDEAYKKCGTQAQVLPFIDNMSEAYGKSDIVVARSGAGTISEITALGLPSILIPFPHATNNHQLENAKVVERAGGGIVIEEKDLNTETLLNTLNIILDNEKLIDMAAYAKKIGNPQAAGVIVDEIYVLAGD